MPDLRVSHWLVTHWILMSYLPPSWTRGKRDRFFSHCCDRKTADLSPWTSLIPRLPCSLLKYVPPPYKENPSLHFRNCQTLLTLDLSHCLLYVKLAIITKNVAQFGVWDPTQQHKSLEEKLSGQPEYHRKKKRDFMLSWTMLDDSGSEGHGQNMLTIIWIPGEATFDPSRSRVGGLSPWI